ncbi:15-hydroxyprostaglandin dehydrogenase [nad(+)] [Holotrichia oblita]|uniref:15-hydroxyprostaglandin dehydrogenase [nad(+)] n=1 Tax=Holotrichia oblita TaxID=644536 RepID=A0ACB9TXN1_HOLOL|nr:15-hydroxyprostaglandin dehydrogenase [nad(+)] [Holotrichia oblita]
MTFINGKVAIVTGGCSGIGLAIVHSLVINKAKNGTIHGCLLALHEYLPKYKSGDEAAIINLSSTAGLEGYPNIPIYSATKHAIIGLGRSWGHPRHFKETKVRVMTVCPNATETPLLNAMPGRNLGPIYEQIFTSTPLPVVQSTNSVANCVANMLDNGTNGSIWLVEAGRAYEVKLPDVESLKNV